MSGSLNVALVGRVAREPKLSKNRGGLRAPPIDACTGEPRVRASFTLSVEHPGDREPSHFKIACHGIIAERAVTGIRRGDRAVVLGQLVQRFNTRGGERSTVVVFADEVGLALSLHDVAGREMGQSDVT